MALDKNKTIVRKKAAHRPLLKIDWKEVDRLLVAQCFGSEIAAYLGININSLYRRCERDKGVTFSEYSQTLKSQGRALLRLKQFEDALNGDRGMLIWLGKNILKQSDKQEVNSTSTGQVTVINYGDKKAEQWKEIECANAR